jgi:hypothetical protein
MKISTTTTAFVAALFATVPSTVAAFSTSGSYLDSLGNTNINKATSVSAAPAPVVPQPQQQQQQQQLPLIPQEPVLQALDKLDGDMNRMHDENMQALLEISASFKKLNELTDQKQEAKERVMEDEWRVGNNGQQQQQQQQQTRKVRPITQKRNLSKQKATLNNSTMAFVVRP